MFTLKIANAFEFNVDNLGVTLRLGKRGWYWSTETGLVRD